MSMTVEIPDVDQAYASCGSHIFDHEPIFVRDCTDDCGSSEYFCNHACPRPYRREQPHNR
jgi:hypothetical protein